MLACAQVADLKTAQYKFSQTLFGERSAEKELVSEIAGAQAQNRNLAGKIASLDEKVRVRTSKLSYFCHAMMRPSSPLRLSPHGPVALASGCRWLKS